MPLDRHLNTWISYEGQRHYLYQTDPLKSFSSYGEKREFQTCHCGSGKLVLIREDINCSNSERRSWLIHVYILKAK
uniref:Uncharacterized protein n=1 Tax=Cucumis sativus TaxID=3659 RepID=A0A0A0L033_CUCSA